MLAWVRDLPGVARLTDQGFVDGGSLAIVAERFKGLHLFDYIDQRGPLMTGDDAHLLLAQARFTFLSGVVSVALCAETCGTIT